MPLSTINWGSSNAGGVDSVCQMISQYISENCNPKFHYRIVAIEQLGGPKEFNETVHLSDNVELVWIQSKKKIGKKLSIPSLFYYMYKVRQQVKLYRPDVIHSHLWSAILICKRTIPSVVTVHSYKNIARRSVSVANDFLYVDLLPLVYRFYGHRIVCVGEALKNSVSKEVSQPVLSIGNPIDADYFIDRKEGLRGESVSLVTCALLTPRKQVEKIILLANLLRETGVNCKLKIIGPESDINYTNKLKAQIESLGLVQSVEFIGQLNKKQIINCYARSDIGVFFSKEETFGLAPLEMLATGLPILATKVGVLAEEKSYFSSIGVTFVNVNDSADMLSKAENLLVNHKKVNIAALREKYAVNNIVEKYENLYLELLGDA